ncbi:MAG: c-type cytochrome [Alphaproteobacteria bacterium]|nr:c-type cytochrome [Alphaproteobacteria bacterium]
MVGAWPALAESPAAERGRYVFAAGGCHACHTDEAGGGRPLAGGPELTTPFGKFFAPNITPDPAYGIGRWSDAQFLRAMREGIAPDGRLYYPVFPYTAYAKASERDLLDLKAYLSSVQAVSQPSRPHQVAFPFSIRLLVGPWRLLNFERGAWRLDPARDAVWNRGSYLVKALSHCGECHTPRDSLGSLDRGRWMAGARMPGRRSVAPNLTPDASGLADWSEADIVAALAFGTLPQGGVLGEEMGEVVRHGTSKLTHDDRRAIAVYLKSLPPRLNAVAPMTGAR